MSLQSNKTFIISATDTSAAKILHNFSLDLEPPTICHTRVTSRASSPTSAFPDIGSPTRLANAFHVSYNPDVRANHALTD